MFKKNNNGNNIVKNNKEPKINDFDNLISKKIDFFKDIIQKTLLYIQKNKTLDILGVSDVVICLDKLTELNNKLNEITKISSSENIITTLQTINNDISSVIKNYGTESLNDSTILLVIPATTSIPGIGSAPIKTNAIDKILLKAFLSFPEGVPASNFKYTSPITL
jgi:predicted transcriptional regulator